MPDPDVPDVPAGQGPLVGEDGVARCPWGDGPAMRTYHDTEWGLPVVGEDALFERLTLEAFQAGLSWRTVLDKRDHFREVFHGFAVEAVAALTDEDVERLLGDPGIIRNRAKIEAARGNAAATIALREEGGLASYVDSFLPPDTPRPRTTAEVPTVSTESTALSRALRTRGFRFVGPTTMHALMEATGMVDTHLLGCHRRGCGGRWPS